jgi:hypothetical protein
MILKKTLHSLVCSVITDIITDRFYSESYINVHLKLNFLPFDFINNNQNIIQPIIILNFYQTQFRSQVSY